MNLNRSDQSKAKARKEEEEETAAEKCEHQQILSRISSGSSSPGSQTTGRGQRTSIASYGGGASSGITISKD